MRPINSPQEIRSVLQEQCDIGHELLQILSREHTELSGNDLPGLETTLAAKQRFMDRFEELSRDFTAMVRQYSTDKKDGIAKFLQHKDPQGEWGLEPLWRQVGELLAECRRKNSTNGKIIFLNHRHIQRALEILRHGEQTSAACYNPGGASQSSAPSRILGKV
jgi:flagellar biosynthesis/type III secretory pathway chaperone